MINCIDKSVELMAIIDDYENKRISREELKKIRKEFKLNRLSE